jgi:hypothetical protein
MTQPRKGQKFVSVAVLLRDAQPRWREIEGEPDLRERRRNERRREIAIDEIVTIYRDYKEQGRLRELPPGLLIYCRRLKSQNSGKLPKRKGGRPPDEHKKLLIAVNVAEALAEQTGRQKSVTQAVRHVHNTLLINGKRCTVPENTIRDYYYDRASGFQEAIAVELACRRIKTAEPVPEPDVISLPVDLTEPSWVTAQKQLTIRELGDR